jgi:hypothetical protein
MGTVDDRTLNRTLLDRQLLLRRHEREAADVVEALVGLQAQDPRTPYTALWSRIVDLDPLRVSGQLAAGELLRVAFMRSTIHLVTAEDCARLDAVFRPALVAYLTGTGAVAKALAGVDLEELAAEARRILTERPATWVELGAALQARWPDRGAGELAVAARQLMPLAQAPPRGEWQVTAPARHQPADVVAGRALQATPDLDRIVLRYLEVFGPASAADIRTWSGLPGTRASLDRLDGQLRRYTAEDGRTLYDTETGVLVDGDVPAPVRLLPQFDNLWLGHADRSRILPAAHRATVQRTIASGRPLLLLDGHIAGGWRAETKRGTTTIVCEPFQVLRRRDRTELAAEAEALAGFLRPDTAAAVRFDA